MTATELTKDIEDRIQSDIKHFKERMPERYSIAWHGYIASLYEFSFISQEHYAKLFDLLPKINEPNPIAEIFSGRDEDDE
jgi:hypothetical protein